MPIKIDFDKAQLRDILDSLKHIKVTTPRVYTRAVNRVLVGMRTEAVNEIRQDYTLKAKPIRDSFRLGKATFKDLNAVLECSGKSLGIIHYSTRKTKKGVTVQIKKGEKRKLLKHAFPATMKSGHLGIFWRERSATTGRLVKRLPIHEIFSSKIPEIFGNESIIQPVLSKGGNRLEIQLERELRFELSKLQ